MKYIYFDVGMFGGVKFYEWCKRWGYELKFVLVYDFFINRLVKKYVLNCKI